MKDVVTAILGGGQGLRLWPLTRHRAKPAVPVGGKFRLIDIPISNSLHAGIDQVYLLTQFNSASLHRHIAQTYRFDVFSQGFVNILAAEQTPSRRDWYQGTADAVRQNISRLTHAKPSEVLILSGDQLYLMSMKQFVKTHREQDADLTIAVKPVPAEQASELGVMRIDGSGRIVEFVEKPSDPAVIESLALDAAMLELLGLDAAPGTVLASMGIYVFKSDVLTSLLQGTSTTDFGNEIIPAAIHEHRVFSFVHDGYWRDIGTIGAFHEANIELTRPLPALNLYDPKTPIYTHPRFLPGCKITRSPITNSVLCDGSIITESTIADSLIGIRARIHPGSVVQETVVMGASEFSNDGDPADGGYRGIGEDCNVRRAIIDFDATIGAGSRLMNEQGIDHLDGEDYCIRDGIIVVSKAANLPPGTVI